MRLFFFLLTLVYFCMGCEDTEEGCLDRRASNFSVTAVNACDTCCVFPVGNLNVTYVYDYGQNGDSLSFAYNRDYRFNDDDTVRFISFRLALTDLELFSDGQSLSFLDTMRNVSPTTADDYLLMEGTSRIEMGHTDYEASLDAFSMRLGFESDVVDKFKPFIDLHPDNRINEVISKLYNDTIDVFAKASMEIELKDSIYAFEIFDIPDPLQSYMLETPVALVAGQGWEIPVRVDMKQLLIGLTEDDDDLSVLSETVAGNIPAAIIIR